MWATKISVTVLFLSVINFQSAFCTAIVRVPLRKFYRLIPELKDAFGLTVDADEHTDTGNQEIMELVMIQEILTNNQASDNFYNRPIVLDDIIDFFMNVDPFKKQNREEIAEITDDEASEIVTSIYESFRRIAAADSDVWNIFDISDRFELMEPTLIKFAETAAMEKKWDYDGSMEEKINRQYKIFYDYFKTGENFAKFMLHKIAYILICKAKMSTNVKEVLPMKFYEIIKELSRFEGTPGIFRLHLLKIARFRILYSFNVIHKANNFKLSVNLLQTLIEDDYIPNKFCM